MTHTPVTAQPETTLIRLDEYIAERWPDRVPDTMAITVRNRMDPRSGNTYSDDSWYVQDDDKEIGDPRRYLGDLLPGERPTRKDGFPFIVRQARPSLTAFQQESLDILRRLEGRETLPNLRSYVATCFSCTPVNEHDHAQRTAGQPELVKTFASADGTRAFILNHAGHRTKFQLR